MKKYEIALLVDVSVGSDVTPILDGYVDILSKNFCIVHSVDNWGTRKLSYPIKKNFIANYAFITASISKNFYSSLFFKLRQDKRILRFMFTKEGSDCVEKKKIEV